MLIDRPQVVENSVIVNASIPFGTSFPSSANLGELFYLTTGSVGLYSYSGAAWVLGANATDLTTHVADTTLHLTSAENALIDAITVTAADINSIPSVTSRVTATEGDLDTHIADAVLHLSAAQNTFLDGLNLPSLTAAEVNFVNGATSNIQTQINAAVAINTTQTTDISNLQASLTSNVNNLQTQLNTHTADQTVHLTAAQNTLLDGLAGTLTATELNFVDGVTSNIQSQINTLSSSTTTSLNTKLNIDGTNAMTGNLSVGGNRVINVATPTTGSDAATKDYVDNFVQGLHWVGTTRTATTANITLSGLQTIDDIVLVTGDRVLVKNQTSTSANGIWLAASGAWSRATDYNTVTEINNSAVFVLSGTSTGKTTWVQLSTVATVNSDPITFTAFSGPVINSAGPGISLGANGMVSVLEGPGITFVSDGVAADVYSGGGLLLTTNGSTASTASTAQLALTNVGSAGTYRSVTTDAKGRVTAGTNPTTLAGYGITDGFSTSGGTLTGNLIGTAFRAAQGVPNNSDSSTNGYAFGGDGDTGMFGPGSGVGAGTIAFYTNNIERVRITHLGAITLDTVSVTGGEVTGDLLGNATTATTATEVVATAAANSSADLVYGTMASNDFFRIHIGGAANAGFAELATADDGTEPIYVRQYTGVFATIARTATLLDGSGNTSFPGTVSAPTFSGALSGNSSTTTLAVKASTLSQGGGTGTAMTFNWSGQAGQPTWLWGGNDGVNMYVYNPSNFNVNYAATSGTAAQTTSISSAVGSSYVWTGLQNFRSNNNTATGAQAGLTAYSDNGSGAIMSFLRSGNFAVNMGLDSDNVFRIGGWSASANRLQMDMSGNLTMAGDVTAFSDIRKKKDIEVIQSAGEKVAQLRGVTFTRLEDNQRSTGVIAQEVLAVLPEAVLEDGDGTLSVKYGNLVGLLIEAIKELQLEVAKLKNIQ